MSWKPRWQQPSRAPASGKAVHMGRAWTQNCQRSQQTHPHQPCPPPNPRQLHLQPNSRSAPRLGSTPPRRPPQAPRCEIASQREPRMRGTPLSVPPPPTAAACSRQLLSEQPVRGDCEAGPVPPVRGQPLLCWPEQRHRSHYARPHQPPADAGPPAASRSTQTAAATSGRRQLRRPPTRQQWPLRRTHRSQPPCLHPRLAPWRVPRFKGHQAARGS